MTRKKLAWAALLGVSTAVLAAQLVPVKRTNPPIRGTLGAPPAIAATLKRACYDCHSNQTRWPWYSRLAPISWWAAHDVALGRKEVNFSEWGSYYPAARRRKLEWMGRALRGAAMPPWTYRLLHPQAQLSGAERAALLRWIGSELSNISTRIPN